MKKKKVGKRSVGNSVEKKKTAGEPSLTIRVSKQAGYCYGVQRALDLAFSAAQDGRTAPIYTLGPIIHNPQVVESLMKQSIRAASDIDEIEKGTVIIRSHGVDPKVIEKAKERGIEVIDATCPFVKKAQQKAAELSGEGFWVVILGERDHPEVLSILAYAGERASVVEKPEDVTSLPENIKRVGVVVQTTQSVEKLDEAVEMLKKNDLELKIHNTICSSTTRRQEEAKELTKNVDVMLVVGGKNSANTTRLAEMCSEMSTSTHHIETADEIDPSWFSEGDVVGVTSGASTSQWILRQVIDYLEKIADGEV